MHKIFQTVLANNRVGRSGHNQQSFYYFPTSLICSRPCLENERCLFPSLPNSGERTINKNKDAFSVLKILRVLLCFQVLSRSKEKTPTIERLLHTAFTSILKGVNQHTERKHLESVDLQGYISSLIIMSSCQLFISLVAWLLHPSYKEEWLKLKTTEEAYFVPQLPNVIYEVQKNHYLRAWAIKLLTTRPSSIFIRGP